MKKLALIIVLLAVSLLSKAQNDLASNVNYIRSQFVAINKDCKNITPVSLENSDESTEGGELIAYKAEGTVIKIQSAYYGEMGKLITDYYYDEFGLIFVFSQSYAYNAPMYDEESFDLNKAEVTENRYYFKNDKLIKWLDENKKAVSTSLFNEKQGKVLGESSRFLRKISD